jgi:hypothetical protein
MKRLAEQINIWDLFGSINISKTIVFRALVRDLQDLAVMYSMLMCSVCKHSMRAYFTIRSHNKLKTQKIVKKNGLI